MFALLSTRIPPSLKKSLPSASFCTSTAVSNTNRAETALELLQHLKPGFKVDEVKQLYQQAYEIHLNAQQINPETVHAVRSIAEKSLCNTIEKIGKRVPNSAKGIMYVKHYYQEVLKGKDYASYELDFKEQRYPCFQTTLSICHFKALPGVLATDALYSFLEGPTAVDCGSTIESVYLKAVLDVLGADKFNKLFTTNALQISPFASHRPHPLSSVSSFIEPTTSHLTVHEDELKIGDAIFISGTPWHHLKHPRGVMGGMHAIVVDHDSQNKPLILGLDMKNSCSIQQRQQDLVDATNAPRTKEDIAFCRAYSGASFSSPAQIAAFFADKPHLQRLTKADILKSHTLEAVKQLGGCQLVKASRLSAYTLAVLKEADLSSDLPQKLHIAKAISLSQGLFSL